MARVGRGRVPRSASGAASCSRPRPERAGPRSAYDALPARVARGRHARITRQHRLPRRTTARSPARRAPGHAGDRLRRGLGAGAHSRALDRGEPRRAVGHSCRAAEDHRGPNVRSGATAPRSSPTSLPARMLHLHAGSRVRLAIASARRGAAEPGAGREGHRDGCWHRSDPRQCRHRERARERSDALRGARVRARKFGENDYAFDGAYVRLGPGQSKSAFTTTAQGLARRFPQTGGSVLVADESDQAAKVEHAIRPQAVALALFAALTALDGTVRRRASARPPSVPGIHRQRRAPRARHESPPAVHGRSRRGRLGGDGGRVRRDGGRGRRVADDADRPGPPGRAPPGYRGRLVGARCRLRAHRRPVRRERSVACVASGAIRDGPRPQRGGWAHPFPPDALGHDRGRAAGHRDRRRLRGRPRTRAHGGPGSQRDRRHRARGHRAGRGHHLRCEPVPARAHPEALRAVVGRHRRRTIRVAPERASRFAPGQRARCDRVDLRRAR